MIDLKTIIERAAADVKKNPPRDKWKSRQGFNLVSLGAWLELVEKAKLPHVPATKIASIPIDELFDGLDNPDTAPRFKAFMDAQIDAEDHETIFRWDCCAPGSIKSHMDRGKVDWIPEFARPLHPEDCPRAGDLIYEFPGPLMSVWQRPWMEAALWFGWPVEYRVYVQDSKIIGVSNYYIQRPLPDGPTTRQHMHQCRDMTEQLIELVPLPIRIHGGAPDDYPTDEISFTADFMVLKSGEVVWLEGGPPFGPVPTRVAMMVVPCLGKMMLR